MYVLQEVTARLLIHVGASPARARARLEKDANLKSSPVLSLLIQACSTQKALWEAVCIGIRVPEPEPTLAMP